MDRPFISDEDFIGILKTILSFLDSHNFTETSRTFLSECKQLGYKEVQRFPREALALSISKDGLNQTLIPISETTHVCSVENTFDAENNVKTNICLFIGETDNSNVLNQADFKLSPQVCNNSKEPKEESIDIEDRSPTKVIYINHDEKSTSSNYINIDKDQKEDLKNLLENNIEQIKEQNLNSNSKMYSIKIKEEDDNECKDKIKICTEIECSNTPSKENQTKCSNMSPKTSTISIKRSVCKDSETVNRLKSKSYNKNLSSPSTPIINTAKTSRAEAKSAPDQINISKEDSGKKHETDKHKNITSSIRKFKISESQTENDLGKNLNYQELKEKFYDLQQEHKKLMGVASELTMALQSNILGQSENLSSMLNNCRKIYPDLFIEMPEESLSYTTTPRLRKSLGIQTGNIKRTASTTNIETITSQHASMIKFDIESDKQHQEESTDDFSISLNDTESETTIKVGFNKKHPEEKSGVHSHNCGDNSTPAIVVSKEGSGMESGIHIPPQNDYFELNFRKLKKDLLKSNYETRLRLLQALRWRITKNNPEVRDLVMGSYIRHDLLGLHTTPTDGIHGTFLEIFYCPRDVNTPHPIQESIARLINSFASLTVGRDYLSQDDDFLVSLILPLVLGTHYSKVLLNDITKDMMMATLQKLSLRNRQRQHMIAAGLVEYLITFLTINHDVLTNYCLEYSMALFMNLCLHQKAREACRSRATDVINLLIKFLTSKHLCCMPYINGAMYSLLGDPIINREAHRLNLTELLQRHIKRSNGEMKKQLEFILKVHLEGEEDVECGCDPNTEPQEEVDLIEDELDEGDEMLRGAVGEKLLKNYKLLFQMHSYQIPSKVTCLCRPLTPRPKSSTKEENKSICPKASRILVLESPDQQKDLITEETQQYKEEADVDNHDRCVSNLSDRSFVKLQDDDCVCPKADEEKQILDENVPFQCKQRKSAHHSYDEDKRSNKSSTSSSPERSFSEETKQFYHKPSAKRGIFDTKPPIAIQKVAPSFTRTIPNSPLCEPMSAKVPSPPCMFRPKENSSARNPPFALDFYEGPTTCYKENYRQPCFEQRKSEKCNCEQHNKYSCHCYDEVKSFLDRITNNNSLKQLAQSPRSLRSTVSSTTTKESKRTIVSITFDTSRPETAINADEGYLLLPQHLDLDGNSTGRRVCSNHKGLSECECNCYRAVFMSRPKILRTP